MTTVVYVWNSDNSSERASQGSNQSVKGTYRASKKSSINVLMTRGGTHLLLYYFILVLLPTIAAQPGFISIDCGSSTNYTDNIGLNWSTDDSYISFGSNVQISSAQKQLSTARHFQRRSNKFCYSLPVTANSSYLLRASFLYGDLEPQVPPGYTFGLSIDFTVVGNVSVTESSVNEPTTVEFLTASTIQQEQIVFCLLSVVGDPFISSLELRPLDPSMYGGYMFSSQYGVLQTRWNCGISTRDPAIRYKDDMHDRIWPPPDRPFNYPSVSADMDLQPSDLLDGTVPPPAVMRTAWETKSIAENITVIVPFDAGAKFYVGLYFQEISANQTDERVLDVAIDHAMNLFFQNLTLADQARYVYDYTDRIDNDHVVFTVKANPSSTLPPILNAFELHAIYPTVDTTTGDSDVAALEILKQSLDLTGWTGDPCLPVSWDWVNCSDNSPAEITQLKLSGYQLHGTIPVVLATLSALTDLWLDDNFITGPLPDLGGLSQLKTLHLQNNSLSGPIPASLASIPSLQELFLESNNFNGSVPPELLNKIGLKLQVDNSVNSSTAVESHHKSKSFGASGALIGAIVGAVLVVAFVAFVSVWCCVRSRSEKQKARPAARRTDNSAGVHADQLHITKAFSLAELQRVTSNFAREIGRGGYGPVFYGKLDNGVEVAVKQNSITSGQGQAEFYTEVSLLSRVHHRNLVSLTGYCDEGDENVLIYEFMNGGTLSQRLYGKDMARAIEWQARISIALDAARGLEYLHYDCNPRIIHRDVKSSNILLNERLQAKVADFGISKTTNEGATTDFSTTKVVGTRGYLDPEYFVTNRLTYKSDVFAFGVVLLEIISGRPPFDERISSLIVHVRQKLIGSNLEAIIDPALRGDYNKEAMWKLADLAMSCVEPASKNRPDMRDVVRELVEVKRYQDSNDPVTISLRMSPGISDSADQLEGLPATSSFTTDLHQDEDIRPWSPGSHDSIRNGPWQLIQPK